MATIDDVAKASGVSKGTVSSVFSKKRSISKEVTERVLAAARSLNYRPNYWARSLANRSTRILGLNIRGESFKFGQFHLSLLNGVLRICYEHGYRLLVNTLSPSYLNQVENIASDPIDGEILLDPMEGDARIEDRLRSGIPIVIIGRPPEPYEKAGLVPKKELLVCKPQQEAPSHSFGYRSALEMLTASPQITAIIVDTDMMALGVYKAAEQLGLSIPEQLSVIAFSDNSVLSPEFTPPLSGVRLNADRLGTEAIQLLLEQMNASEKSAKRVLIPAELVIRGSCAVPMIMHK
ncbi:DNA-binding LacI/PurR family transcriptional regulator [Paenibacillus taihuensis]|uniref:DNA-binding LacI/PurR family transcriptional regulator n=1 Tax=Paenibacillus taihuensis TaxID=1156355 RepID=A0A3D9SD88_9BACL|nr:LacI family DNA-binding transcriptional regulator [Paenibacillus taihuensis]REE92826.1 DNA-binding LacI/PurR family transcriptional regulator [Paenibacillus taihuensis]